MMSDSDWRAKTEGLRMQAPERHDDQPIGAEECDDCGKWSMDVGRVSPFPWNTSRFCSDCRDGYADFIRDQRRDEQRIDEIERRSRA